MLVDEEKESKELVAIRSVLENTFDSDALSFWRVPVCFTDATEQAETMLKDVRVIAPVIRPKEVEKAIDLVLEAPFFTLDNDFRILVCLEFLSKLINADIECRPHISRLLIEKLLSNSNFWNAWLLKSRSKYLKIMVAMIIEHWQFLDYKARRQCLRLFLNKLSEIPDFGISASSGVADIQYLCATMLHMPGSIPLLMMHEIAQAVYIGSSVLRYPWYVSDILESYKEKFDFLTKMLTIAGKSWLFPVNRHTQPHLMIWKLHHQKLKFVTVNTLFSSKSKMTMKQKELTKYVLSRQCDREWAMSVFGQQWTMKSKLPVLEEQFAKIAIEAMIVSEQLDSSQAKFSYWSFLLSTISQYLIWHNISLAGFCGCMYKQFPMEEPIPRDGRYWLCWLIYHLFLVRLSNNGKYCPSKFEFKPYPAESPANDLAIVFDLICTLFPESEQFPLQQGVKQLSNDPSGLVHYAPGILWRAIATKLVTRNDVNDWPYLLRPYYKALNDFILEASDSSRNLDIHKLELLFNMVEPTPNSWHVDNFVQRFAANHSMVTFCPTKSATQCGPEKPASVGFINLMGPGSRIAIARRFCNMLLKGNSSKEQHGVIGPGGVETFARILSFPENEIIGTGDIANLLRVCCRDRQFSSVMICSELLCIRLKPSQSVGASRLCAYGDMARVAGAKVTGTSVWKHLHLMNMFHFGMLNIVSSSSSYEFLLTLQKTAQEDLDGFVYSGYGEMNKFMAMKIAKSIAVAGITENSHLSIAGIKLLRKLLEVTPHSWPQNVLNMMPKFVADIFVEHENGGEAGAIQTEVKENYENLMRVVQSVSDSGLADVPKYLETTLKPELFMAFLYKYIHSGRPIKNCIPICKSMMAMLSTSHIAPMVNVLVDYLTCEFRINSNFNMKDVYFKNCIDTLLHMCFTLNVITLDQLIYTLLFRDTSDLGLRTTSVVVICLLLKCKQLDEGRRIIENVSAEFSNNDEWHSQYVELQKKLSERTLWEGLKEITNVPGTDAYFSTFYTNLMFRMIPILDMMIHRCIEVPQFFKQTEKLLFLADLYKFHSDPTNYLYSTLFMYDTTLSKERDDSWVLVKTILLVVLRSRPEEKLYYSATFLREIFATIDCQQSKSVPSFNVHEILFHYINCMTRSLYDNRCESITFDPRNPREQVACLHGDPSHLCSNCSWDRMSPVDRNSAFSIGQYFNNQHKVLHAAAIQILVSCLRPADLWNLINRIFLSRRIWQWTDLMYQQMNAVSLLYSALPEKFWDPFFAEWLDVFESVDAVTVQMFNPDGGSLLQQPSKISNFVAVIHPLLEHATEVQLNGIVNICSTKIPALCTTEKRFLFYCQCVLPYLQRIQLSGASLLLQTVKSIYDAIGTADWNVADFECCETISNMLYFIKYKLTGDQGKEDCQKVVAKLRCTRLRDMLAMLNKASSTTSTNLSNNQH